jgi:hypothetical protein
VQAGPSANKLRKAPPMYFMALCAMLLRAHVGFRAFVVFVVTVILSIFINIVVILCPEARSTYKTY